MYSDQMKMFRRSYLCLLGAGLAVSVLFLFLIISSGFKTQS